MPWKPILHHCRVRCRLEQHPTSMSIRSGNPCNDYNTVSKDHPVPYSTNNRGVLEHPQQQSLTVVSEPFMRVGAADWDGAERVETLKLRTLWLCPRETSKMTHLLSSISRGFANWCRRSCLHLEGYFGLHSHGRYLSERWRKCSTITTAVRDSLP